MAQQIDYLDFGIKSIDQCKLPSIDLNLHPVSLQRLNLSSMIIYNSSLGTSFHLTFRAHTIFAVGVLTTNTQGYPVASR